MAKLSIKVGSTSKTVKVFVQDSSSSVGAGLTALVYNSGSLTAYYVKEGDSSTTAVSLVTATLGTWTSGGFVVVDGTHAPGLYEFGLPNTAIASGKSVVFYLFGATNMTPVVLEIELTATDNQDAVRGGMTALPNAAPGANGGLPTGNGSGFVGIQTGTGAGQLDFTSGVVKASLVQILGTALTETAGQIAAAFIKFFNVATPTGSVNSLPNAATGATGGIAAVGSNMGTVASVVGAVGGAVGSVTAAVQIDLTQAVPTTNTDETVGDALNAARADGFGSWRAIGTTVELLAADKTTVVHTFTLDTANVPTSRTEA